MGRKRRYTPLNVFLNSLRIGQLTRESTGAVSFAYAADWLEREHSLPVSLSLPLREGRYVGAPVLAVFDNLLPDNEPVRRLIAERVGADGIDAFSLLSEIGRDCVGALQFVPDDAEFVPRDRPGGEPLNERQIAELLRNLGTAPLGIRRERDFRISVTGAQEKTALLFHDGEWIEPAGATPTTHIIKPQIGRLANGVDLSNSVENEYLCLKVVEGLGIRAAHGEIATFEDRKALVIERFDRRWTADGRLIRLPQEDCCQALSVPSTRKYQNEGGPGIVEVMELLSGSDERARDRLDFFTANVVFWLIGATDGHAKNFSLALLPGGRFHMTPLYDVLTVQPMVDSGTIRRNRFRLAMRMGQSNRYRVHEIRGRHIMESGSESGLSRDAIAGVFEGLSDRAGAALESAFNDLPAGFPGELIDSIAGAVHKRLPLLGQALEE